MNSDPRFRRSKPPDALDGDDLYELIADPDFAVLMMSYGGSISYGVIERQGESHVTHHGLGRTLWDAIDRAARLSEACKRA